MTLLGLVRLKQKKTSRGDKGGKKKKKQQLQQFALDEAVEDSEEEEEEERDAKFALKFKELHQREALNPFSDLDENSSEEDNDSEDDNGDVIENALQQQEKEKPPSKEKYNYHFLYSLTLSGKEKPIVNNLPGAVAVLSNSKKIFLGHINNMLICSDPRLVELCYIDTDSCIFSMTYPNWEDCLMTDQLERWNRSQVMADESGTVSCHGQMKCEGVYNGGLFKTLKIYRLFGSGCYPSPATADFYTRCKGVNRHLAEKLKNSDFDVETGDKKSTVVTRTCLRPTASGQILMTKESRSLSMALNFKRKVTSNGVHTFPISFVAEC